MVQYQFKAITVVPSGKDMIDVVLSKTQRKTPTVVHPGYAISRIRSFYMRKVKFTAATCHEKLSKILDDFPRIDDIHPFYADLINVLYDKDHYKLAMGQLATARHLIDNIGKDYVRLLKYGDSLYRCKLLKRAALGRMCTLLKKQSASLAYLENVRQHLARLPSIDPTTRTLLVTGYPNVGKSSFLTKTTRADVEVQPYAFTTKSLFVGHFDFEYQPWQLIDTPGLLDRPLEDRNTIEMLAITALAHLRSAVLYFVDISEQCGFHIEQQVNLFHSIKPLFANKPILVVLNKTDIVKPEDLSEDKKAHLATIEKEGFPMVPMSNISEEGISQVKEAACMELLKQRVSTKMKSQKAADILNRLHVAMPKARDNKVRDTFVPDTVRQAKANGAADMMDDNNKAVRKLERDLEAENGGPGVYEADFRKYYDLANPDHKYDIIPEIVNGHNISDFVDPDIDNLIAKVEEEEEARMAQASADAMDEDAESSLDSDEKAMVEEIRERKALIIRKHRQSKGKNRAPLPRTKNPKFLTVSGLASALDERGRDPELAKRAPRARGRSRSARGDGEGAMVATKRARQESQSRGVSQSRGRSRSQSRGINSVQTPRAGEGYKNLDGAKNAYELDRKAKKRRNQDGRRGEADRFIGSKMPKHLNSGKRGFQHDRR